MTLLVKAFLAAAAALALGLGITQITLKDGGPFDIVEIGPWRIATRAGAVDADPYTRAGLEQRGEIPLALGEGLQLVARRDDAGRALDPRCVYSVGPRAPTARYWSLELVDLDGFPVDNPAGRYVFRSSEILRNADGGFAIWVSARRIPATGCRSALTGPSRSCCGSMIPRSARPPGRPGGRAEDPARGLRMRLLAALGELVYYVVVVAVMARSSISSSCWRFPVVATRDAYAALLTLGAPGETVLLPSASPTCGGFPISIRPSPPPSAATTSAPVRCGCARRWAGRPSPRFRCIRAMAPCFTPSPTAPPRVGRSRR